MRRLISRIIGIAFLALTICSCNGDDNDQPTFDTVRLDKEVTLDKAQDSPKCKISISVHYVNDSTQKAKAMNDAIERKLFDMKDVTMREAADSFANRYLDDYVRTIKPLYKEDRNDKEKRSWYEYHYNISTEIRKGHKDVTVYVINSEYYEGGVHGIEQQLIMNFDAKSGKLLTLKDVFINGFEKKLNDILLSTLEKKTGAKGVTELHEKDYLRSTDIFAPENFILGKDGITFIYNVYEIAPYAKGKTELEIPYSRIDDLLNKMI